MKLRVAYLILLFLTAFNAQARMSPSQTAEQIFESSFKTLRTVVNNDFMAPPVISLNGNDRLSVSFDEISDDPRQLQARLVHCNADWSESGLQESEFLSGFNFADIEDYAFSSNTFVHYVNYRLDIDSSQLLPLVSGNYLLQVYDRDDPDNVLLQSRFSVCENLVAIDGGVTTRTDRGVNDRLQQLALRVNGNFAELGNPYQDLIVKITQNRRPETTQTLSHPMRVENNAALFEHDMRLIFPASNEYRRFETVRTDMPGMNVDSIRFGGTNYHAWLTTDRPRLWSEYNYDSTQFGRFLIREHNSTDSDLGADYITVHFTLDHPWLTDKDIYVDGDFTNHTFSKANRMTYNPEKALYELQVPLKQGAYNYQYVTAPHDLSQTPSTSLTEGDKYETRNEYLIEVFLRAPLSRNDRMLGYTLIYSD